MPTRFAAPPAQAAWHHRGSRDGFEVVFLREHDEGFEITGTSSAITEEDAWAVRYAITLDREWRTVRAFVAGGSTSGPGECLLEADGNGGWRVDGAPAPALDGCLDVDLEASAFTNAFPVHRLGLAVGESASAPAAWVRAGDLSVERLEQHYARSEDFGPHQRYDYEAPDLAFACQLVFDETGLVLEYPGIAVRAV